MHCAPGPALGLPGLLVLVLLLLLAPAAMAETLGETSPPRLTVGDFFEMRDRIGEPGGTTQDRIHKQTVVALERITVGNATYDAVRLEVAFPPTQMFGVNASGTQRTWVRATDGATLKREFVSTQREGDTTRSSAETSTFEAPCVDLVHPLRAGATWTHRCVSTTTSTGSGGDPYTTTQTTTYRVLGTENVTVPAGTFAAYLVEAETAENTFDVEPQKHWYAPEACTIVKTVSIQRGGYSDTFELLSFRCASVGAAEHDRSAISHLPPALVVSAIVAIVALRR